MVDNRTIEQDALLFSPVAPDIDEPEKRSLSSITWGLGKT